MGLKDLWKGKRREPDPIPETDEERRIRLQQQRWHNMLALLEKDPRFQQVTFDGLHWIDPFTGELINAPFDIADTAREHLYNSRHWHGATKVKPLKELRYLKWRHHLKEHFWSDTRFRLFDDRGCWLDPWSRAFVPDIRRSGTVITQDMIDRMAYNLACHENAHPARLPTLEELRHLHPSLAEETQEHPEQVVIENQSFSLPDSTSEPVVRPIEGLRRTSDPGDWRSGASDRITTTRQHMSKGLPPVSFTPDPDSFDGFQTGLSGGAVVPPPLVEEGNSIPADSVEDAPVAFHLEPAPTPTLDEEDLARAREVQMQLLGKVPEIPGLSLRLRYDPYHYIGGDFYDFVPLDDHGSRYLLVIGDVSGHGTQAALLVQSTIKTVRFVCRYAQQHDLLDIICTVNDSIREDMLRGQFLTCFAAIIERNEQGAAVRCLCAGHHPSVIVSTSGPTIMRELGKRGMALGIASGTMLRKQLTVSEEQLVPGETLLVYTDGLNELMNSEDEEYGHWRSRASFLACIDKDLDAILDTVIAYATQFAGEDPQDDRTIFALRVD